MTYGQHLRKTREAAKMSQLELATAVTERGHTITDARISMIERDYDQKRRGGKPTRPAKQFVVFAAEILGDDVNNALAIADYAGEQPSRIVDLNDAVQISFQREGEDVAQYEAAIRAAVASVDALKKLN